MKKTIREWIDLCADDKIREEWNNNLIDSLRELSIKQTMAGALTSSFTWDETVQGHEYWEAIRNDMRNNPKKYLKKRKVMFIYE